MDYLTLIEDALDRMEADWPRDDDERLIPCRCGHAPVQMALVGERPTHTYHRDVDTFDALLAREYHGVSERLWLGQLHDGTATTHPSGAIYVSAFNEQATRVEREADIIPTLMGLWGYEEARAA